MPNREQGRRWSLLMSHRRVMGAGALLAFVLVTVGAREGPKLTLMAMLSGARYVDQAGVVRQEGSFDCGVAAMEMVIGDLTRTPVKFDSARASALERRSGLSFYDMRQLAEERGASAVGRRMSIEQLRKTTVPTVLQFRGHFVVFDGFDGAGSAILRDPAIGRVRISEAALVRKWTGRSLLVSRDEPVR